MYLKTVALRNFRSFDAGEVELRHWFKPDGLL